MFNINDITVEDLNAAVDTFEKQVAVDDGRTSGTEDAALAAKVRKSHVAEGLEICSVFGSGPEHHFALGVRFALLLVEAKTKPVTI